MAITYVGTTWVTAADAWSIASVTPAANDLLVVVGGAVGGANYASQVCTDSTGEVTFSQAIATNRVFAYVSTKCTSTTSRTISVSGTTSETGGGFSLWRVSGQSKYGATAIKQVKRAAVSAGAAPAVTMDAAVNTNNPVFGHANNATNSTTTTAPPSSWTERFDNGFASPTSGGEFCDRASGETNTTITWTANSATAGDAVVLEIDASASSTQLVVADAAHAHAADNLALTQHNILAVADATHGHTADNIALGVMLVLQDALHAHAADGLSLTQHHVLAVADALHGHLADGLGLTQHNILAIADALHAHAADNLTLTQHNVLAVADALHAHAADNLTLTAHEPGAGELVIQEAAHAHSADGDLVLGVGLAIAEALHGHTADNLVLTQHNILVVADALHAHAADNVGVSMTGAAPTGQDFVRLRRRRGIGSS